LVEVKGRYLKTVQFLSGLPIATLMPRLFSYSFHAWLCHVLMGTVAGMAGTSGVWIWSLRYPPSGVKYFRKVIEMDPHCGEAYMYLGAIAFRRFQDRKAFYF
jgi:hypothetical protein